MQGAMPFANPLKKASYFTNTIDKALLLYYVKPCLRIDCKVKDIPGEEMSRPLILFITHF